MNRDHSKHQGKDQVHPASNRMDQHLLLKGVQGHMYLLWGIFPELGSLAPTWHFDQKRLEHPALLDRLVTLLHYYRFFSVKERDISWKYPQELNKTLECWSYKENLQTHGLESPCRPADTNASDVRWGCHSPEGPKEAVAKAKSCSHINVKRAMVHWLSWVEGSSF